MRFYHSRVRVVQVVEFHGRRSKSRKIRIAIIPKISETKKSPKKNSKIFDQSEGWILKLKFRANFGRHLKACDSLMLKQVSERKSIGQFFTYTLFKIDFFSFFRLRCRFYFFVNSTWAPHSQIEFSTIEKGQLINSIKKTFGLRTENIPKNGRKP